MTSLSDSVIGESTTTIVYPKSGRRVVLDNKGNIVSDTAAAAKKEEK